MVDKITKEDEKQLEEQVVNEAKEILEIISPMISRYVGFKASSRLVNNKIAEILGDIDRRLRVIEHLLEISKVEE